MKRHKIMFTFLSVLLAVTLFYHPATATKTYMMAGKISAIDVEHNTVVIDVPLGNGQIFTVGGPCSANAILKKGGRLVSLSDFQVGEKVWVKWRLYENGHLIEAMKTE